MWNCSMKLVTLILRLRKLYPHANVFARMQNGASLDDALYAEGLPHSDKRHFLLVAWRG
jgi:hypothetical protein